MWVRILGLHSTFYNFIEGLRPGSEIIRFIRVTGYIRYTYLAGGLLNLYFGS